MNPVRSRMTRRVQIERDEADEANAYGHAGPPDWQPFDELIPCWLYTRTPGGERVSVERTVVTDQYVLMMPVGVDVTPKDRVNGVEDRLGNVVLGGVHNIRSVHLHHTHLEAVLEGAA